MWEFSWSNVKQHSSYHRSNIAKRLPVRRDSWNWVFSSHGVCSTAFLKSTKGTAAKDISRCKAESRKEVFWSPLDFDVQLVNCQCTKERRKAKESWAKFHRKSEDYILPMVPWCIFCMDGSSFFSMDPSHCCDSNSDSESGWEGDLETELDERLWRETQG